MMFRQFQFGVATNLGLSTALMVSIQAIGAAAGKMTGIIALIAAYVLNFTDPLMAH